MPAAALALYTYLAIFRSHSGDGVTAGNALWHCCVLVLRGDRVRPHEWGGRRAAAYCQGLVVGAVAAAAALWRCLSKK
jgi:hypothetical protein